MLSALFFTMKVVNSRSTLKNETIYMGPLGGGATNLLNISRDQE